MEGFLVLKEDQLIHLEGNAIIEEKQMFFRSEQSANVLFNFMSQLDYLKNKLKDKALIPRYYEERIDYLEIEGMRSIAFPMVCFCDIHLNRLVPHMKNYGRYGIGLNKTWGIQNGIQPIHYINTASVLRSDFSLVFHKALNLTSEELASTSTYNNYLLTNLLFMKPLNGKMMRDGVYLEKNFHDEREWRFVPNLNIAATELPFVIPQEQLNPKAYYSYSEGIATRSEFWINFEYKDIKYLVVEDENDREDIINFIISEPQIDASIIERQILVSKILVFNELKEDW